MSMYYINKLKKSSLRVKLATGKGEEGSADGTGSGENPDSKFNGRTNKHIKNYKKKVPSKKPEGPSKPGADSPDIGTGIDIYNPSSTTTTTTAAPRNTSLGSKEDIRRQLYHLLGIPYGGPGAGFNPFSGGGFNPFSHGFNPLAGSINIGGIGGFNGGFPFYGGYGYGYGGPGPFYNIPGVLTRDEFDRLGSSEPSTTTTVSAPSFNPDDIEVKKFRVRLASGGYDEAYGVFNGGKLVKILDDFTPTAPPTPETPDTSPTPRGPDTPTDTPPAGAFSEEDLIARKKEVDARVKAEAALRAAAADDVAKRIVDIKKYNGQINDRDLYRSRWMTAGTAAGAIGLGSLAWYLRNKRKRVEPFGDDYTEANKASLGYADWTGDGPKDPAGKKFGLTPKRNFWDYAIPAGAATVGGIGGALLTGWAYDKLNPMPKPSEHTITPHYTAPTTT